MQQGKSVFVVSGLPRSGTSMMMRVLAGGGLGIVSDGLREADEDNPHGYYELEAVKTDDASWLRDAQGKVVKVISALLHELPESYHYKVIFLERDLEEIVKSQRTMLARHGKEPEAADPEMMRLFSKHLVEIKQWLAGQEHMDVEYVRYTSMVSDPAESIGRIVEFLGAGLDREAMIRAVDPSLHRQKKGSDQGECCSSSEGARPPTEGPASEKDMIEAQLAALGYI